MATTGSASQTDFTEDLKKITVRVMHGDDDQILPYADSTVGKAAEEWHIENVKGFPHGMPTTEAATIDAELLAFIQKSKEAAV